MFHCFTTSLLKHSQASVLLTFRQVFYLPHSVIVFRSVYIWYFGCNPFDPNLDYFMSISKIDDDDQTQELEEQSKRLRRDRKLFNRQLRRETKSMTVAESFQNHRISTNYDFVFGWSPGHSGTSTLSESSAYGNPADIIFLHESHHCSQDFENVDTRTWRNWEKDDAYEYVKSEYVPFLERCKGSKRTLVDFGHQNMYYIEALVKYLEDETHYSFLFVRIIRSRFELALSLTYDKPRAIIKYDICKRLSYRYCPMDRRADIVHKVPNLLVWESFTNFQKALWMVDEIEWRWKRILTMHPSLHYIELLWSKRDAHKSLDSVASSIASVLNISIPTNPLPVLKVHAGDAPLSIQHLMKEDKEYKEAMKISLQSFWKKNGYLSIEILLFCGILFFICRYTNCLQFCTSARHRHRRRAGKWIR